MDLQLASLITSVAFLIIGMFGLIFLDNLIKKIIALSFLGDAANLFLVSLGYKPGGIIYIILPEMSKELFAQQSVYPLPYALVLTSIVIGASTLAVMLGIIIVLFKKHGSLSASKVLGDDT